MKKIELLAPGGDSRSVKAAILAGADAVYLGVGDFNARKRAVNISLSELEELCLLAHERACRVYLTFNVLALEAEFINLIEFLRATVHAGIDAVILQDYGLLYVIHQALPLLEIHASTQMTTHNRGQIGFLSDTGTAQVNFSRELSLPEIHELATYAHQRGVKVEVFVHGAYCVSFSGQCYMSGALCENSANRGACVQLCRRDYSYGQKRGIRPLNLKDNSLFSSARKLIEGGVDSLKIEGRIKGYEYVYTTVTAWREQLNLLDQGDSPRSRDKRLEAVFNRSFSDNLLKGRLGKDSFTPDPGDKSPRFVTTVEEYRPGKGEILLSGESELVPGQSVTIRSRSGQFICTGTLLEKTGTRAFRFRIDHKLMGKILKGHQIWSQPRIFDFSRIDDEIDALKAVKNKTALRYKLQGRTGKPLTLTASADGREITLTGAAPLEPAENQSTTAENIVERLAKLGNTPFYMEHCDLEGLEKNLFIPMKTLNELRQTAAARLLPLSESLTEPVLFPVLSPAGSGRKKRLAVAVSVKEDLEQIPDDCLRLFQLPSDPYRLEQLRPLFEDDIDLIPWFPSILIGTQYEAACDFLRGISKRQIITDNSGIAAEAKNLGLSWTAGPLLNGTNGYALKLFNEKGASGAFLSAELNSRQISELTIPEGVEFWAPLVAPVLLMKSRHCLIRNCVDCSKSVMDDHCLRNCVKEAEIEDNQKNSILVLKSMGEYNALYSSSLHLDKRVSRDSRIDIVLLDFRVHHQKLMPQCSLNEFIGVSRGIIDNLQGTIEQLSSRLRKPDLSDVSGLDSL